MQSFCKFLILVIFVFSFSCSTKKNILVNPIVGDFIMEINDSLVIEQKCAGSIDLDTINKNAKFNIAIKYKLDPDNMIHIVLYINLNDTSRFVTRGTYTTPIFEPVFMKLKYDNQINAYKGKKYEIMNSEMKIIKNKILNDDYYKASGYFAFDCYRKKSNDTLKINGVFTNIGYTYFFNDNSDK